MASVFTFDPDPPRVSSPWSSSTPGRSRARRSNSQTSAGSVDVGDLRMDDRGIDAPADVEVQNLVAEPQEGPTEYKLHLLLKPRREFAWTSTAKHVAGSQHLRQSPNPPRSVSEQYLSASPAMSQSSSSRQHRFEQLTTQLLWRLQQSAPIHSSSKATLTLPSLPDVSVELQEPRELSQLLPGLEESKGALYEVGVADDGTFVGLAEDEMSESIHNLQVMAASLGCSVHIIRMVPVGECTWYEDSDDDKSGNRAQRGGNLHVAEAYVKPELRRSRGSDAPKQHKVEPELFASDSARGRTDTVSSANDQLRVSLTGATTSGKSSLLGTLSTATLDNGKGKSRLSLLKHRHEVASGVTSSVAQELIGYRHTLEPSGTAEQAEVINYAATNVTTWNDIHTGAANGRLAFLSDSAGHPRYRRTTVRGLVGWAPHWTILCISVGDGTDSPSHQANAPTDDNAVGFAGASAHLSMAHLDLCLRLRLPLIVVFTKLDIAVREGVRQILSTLLSTLKAAGRKPALLANNNEQMTDSDLQRISAKDATEAQQISRRLEDSMFKTVPIVFTSAVKGVGIGKLHALLSSLPIPTPMNHVAFGGKLDESSSVVFHVDDVFNIRLDIAPNSRSSLGSSSKGFVVSGHLAVGRVSLGDELMLGPFSESSASSQAEPSELSRSEPSDTFLIPRSFTDALAQTTSSPKLPRLRLKEEWRCVKVISVRNLRFPVQQLDVDHVGTLGIVPVDLTHPSSSMMIRRGMVLADGNPRASHTVTASFNIDDASSVVVGARIVIYSASVRASAKVVAVALEPGQQTSYSRKQQLGSSDDGFKFSFEDDEEEEEQEHSNDENSDEIHVTFQLTTYREWLEVGAPILVMPSGGSDKGAMGLGSLEGFVGKIVETFG